MFLIESLARIDEQAKITGVALIPRISRNNRLYTKEELKRFDNVSVPLNWEHDEQKRIGQITFHYNPELETVYYDGVVTDEKYALLAKNKTLFTSIEAEPQFSQRVCNGSTDCFEMPFGLTPLGLALTETPGVPETSVNVIESLIKESMKVKEISIDGIIKQQLEDLEKRILAKYDLILALEALLQLDPENQYYQEQLMMCKDDLRWLIDRYLDLKSAVSESKNNSVEKLLKEINFKNIPEISEIIKKTKENKIYSCPKCGGLKK